MSRPRIDDVLARELRQQVRGPVLTPRDADYERARRIWNGRFDRHPAVIARCTEAADVAAALGVVRSTGMPVAVRSGGHDYAGNSVCDDGLVIDLSQMNGVAVDESSRTVRVGPGARWASIDGATQAVGLATTGGTVSTVGVAGFTLGGGSGHLSRKLGLALDNLIAAEVVTASGDVVRATERENADLFWGLRGGSGNLGIVTALDLRLHPLGPDVLAGQIVHPLERAGDVLRLFRGFMAEAPDEVQCWPFFITVPPLPVFPAAFHGRVAIDLVVAWSGDLAEGERRLAPLRQFGTPILDTVAPTPYVTLQQAFDAAMGPSNRWYSKAHYLNELSDGAIDLILARVQVLPGEFTMVYLGAEGGAIGRVDREATAFPHRDAAFSLHIFPGWSHARDDEPIVAWAQEFHQALRGEATGGVYVNLLGGDEPDGPRAAYGANYDRLAELKRQYDPGNLLRLNHNVAP